MANQIKPNQIRLEASTICQLQCPSCPNTQGIIKKNIGAGFLKFEDFKTFIDKNFWISHIELSNFGEIFLNPDLGKIIEYAYRKNVALFASNGVNLNTVSDSVLESLVKYKFRHINCSIDGTSDETYKIYRRRGNFDRVIENIEKINRFKNLYKSEFPQLTWQFIIFGHNEHEIAIARKRANDLNMHFFVKLSFDETFSPVRNKDLVMKESGLGVASHSEFIHKYGRPPYLFCAELWQRPQINWDGRVLGCCINKWGDYGNAFDSDLIQVLNNEKTEYARQMLLGNAESREDIPWYYMRTLSNNA